MTPIQFHPINKPLLAYDGSPRASTVMHSAAEFCSALHLPLTVLTVSHREKSGEEKLLEEAHHYLSLYDLKPTLLSVTGPAYQRIIEYLKEQGHDLLFIGAYGHSRIIEMVLGSTTEYVLRNVPCPVFLSR